MATKAAGKRTCVEEAEHNEARPAAKQVRLRRQSTEQVVAKAIKDNCSDRSASEIDGTIVLGRTLRQTLLSDKRAVRNGESNETFVKRYCERLRDIYCSHGSPAELLACGEDNLPVDGQLRPLQCHGFLEEDTSEQVLRPWANIYIYTGYTLIVA